MIAAKQGTYSDSIKVNPYLLVGIIYLFVNSLYLPFGMLYTMLLTPLFLYSAYKQKLFGPYIAFIGLSIPYFIIHYKLGVDVFHYTRSVLLYFTSVSFATAVYFFLVKSTEPEAVFKKLLLINGVMTLVALWALTIPGVKYYFWNFTPVSPGTPLFPRLQMLSYEASYYSFMVAPLALYYGTKMLFGKVENPILTAILIVVPLALSLSFGVILCLAGSLGFLFIININRVINTRRRLTYLVACIVLLALATGAFFILFPDNIIATRINNIFDYKDTSTRGRTNEAFNLALIIAKLRSTWFGVGPGQIKLIAREAIVDFYKFYLPLNTQVRIPNSVAETLAVYGWVGLAIRYLLTGWLFFKTKVYNNYYRLAVFLFVFVYTLTGSFMFNIVELTMWVIAFSPAFKQFDIQTTKTSAVT